MQPLLCPAMSVDDKYRTLYAALMGVFNDIALYARENLPPEKLQDLINAAMHGVGQSAGKRLVRVYQLKPTVEDALKLLLLLNNESLAYLPKLKQIYAEIDGEVGYLTIKRDPWYDWYFKHLDIDCSVSCSQHEFMGLLSELGGKFRIEVLEALPKGGERCRFRITRER